MYLGCLMADNSTWARFKADVSRRGSSSRPWLEAQRALRWAQMDYLLWEGVSTPFWYVNTDGDTVTWYHKPFCLVVRSGLSRPLPPGTVVDLPPGGNQVYIRLRNYTFLANIASHLEAAEAWQGEEGEVGSVSVDLRVAKFTH